jgi:hypothetical protein
VPSLLRRVRPVLVALGSMPRKNKLMSNSPEVDLAITAGKSHVTDDPLYYVTVEVTRAVGIVPELFLLTRDDDAQNAYTYSRVVSLTDIQLYGTSPVNARNGYRASNVTIKSNSLTFIKEFKEGIQSVVKDLLDRYASAEDLSEFETVTSITLRGDII